MNAEVISLFIGGAGIIATALGAAIGYGALSQKVKGHDDILSIHRDDIKAAADKAEQIPALIASIKALGDSMTQNVLHIQDLMNQSNTHIHDQLTDIKEQIKPRRRSPGD
ncbi:MAG: hypothetical protein WCO83_02255 [Alphaproteobacteria bacterium]